MSYPRIILASQSPRRKELLGRLVPHFEVMPADIDETPLKNEKPLDYCRRVARGKAEKIHAAHPDALVIAADTPVIMGRQIIQSAFTEEEARHMLQQQSGHRVHICTAVCVITPEGKVLEDMSKSWVKFKPLTEQEIAWHLKDKENWHGASGAFKIQQSAAEAFFPQMHGSVTGVVGLPLYQTTKLLRRAGVNVDA